MEDNTGIDGFMLQETMESILSLREAQEPNNVAVKIVWGGERIDVTRTDLTEGRALVRNLIAEKNRYLHFADRSWLDMNRRILDKENLLKKLTKDEENELRKNEDLMDNVFKIETGLLNIMNHAVEIFGAESELLKEMVSAIESLNRLGDSLKCHKFSTFWSEDKSNIGSMRGLSQDAWNAVWRTKEDIDFILKEMKDFLRRAEEGEWPKDIRLVRDGSTIDCLQLMLGAIKKLGVAEGKMFTTDEGQVGGTDALTLDSCGDLVESRAKRPRIDTKVDDNDVKGIGGSLADERLKPFSLRLKPKNVLDSKDSDEVVEEDGEIYDFEFPEDEQKMICIDGEVLSSSPLSPPAEIDAGVKLSSP